MIYVEGENGESIEAAIRILKKGERFGVATLARIAPNRQLLRKYISEIHQRGAIIVETNTGRTLDNPEDAAQAVLDAVDELAQDRRTHTPEEARKHGKKGGRPREERLPDKEARLIWRSVDYQTVPEALSHMPGWSQREAYRKFGGRGILAGRPKST